MKFKAVIWDMDGVMIDSMLYWVAYDRASLAHYGLEFNDELLKLFNGKSEHEVVSWLIDKAGIDKSVDKLLKERMEGTEEIYNKKTIEMPGVTQLIKDIDKTGMMQSIASGSDLHRIEVIISRFGWKPYFNTFFSAENVGFKGKPAPDVYLYAAEQLGLEPNECVVIEDSYNGVLSAKAAGMSCVAVPDTRWSVGDFSSADIVVSSLEDNDIYEFLGL
jgi:HAD superfamily hydrolase (TIGR01509 family)